MSVALKTTVKAAYLEHVNKAGCMRLFPPTLVCILLTSLLIIAIFSTQGSFYLFYHPDQWFVMQNERKFCNLYCIFLILTMAHYKQDWLKVA